MARKLPRGVRNNNPLNIRESKFDGTVWVGERATDDDPEFEEFEDMPHGVRAAGRILLGYNLRYNLWSVVDVICKWAPPKNDKGQFENHTGAYVKAVCKDTGFVYNEPVVKFKSFVVMYKMIQAMARVELGGNYLKDGDLIKGVTMALSKEGK